MLNNTKTIDELEEENFHKLFAPTIYLIILMIIGIPGNLTILIIYGRKNTKSVYRTIIFSLAIVDQTFCMVGIPFNIARIVDYYSFQGEWVCIIGVVVLYFMLVYSTHLLMLLSIHRFRKICFPLKKQMNKDNVNYFVLACFFIALVLSAPHFALPKYVEIDLGKNIKGYSCAISLAKPSIYSTITSYGFLTLFLLYTVILVLMYSLIGRRIYVQRKLQSETKTSTIDKTISSKMTKVAFAISVVFAVSYIPVFTIQITRKYIVEENLNGFTFALLKIGERLYVINHVANPFIYGVFDSQFKSHLKDLLPCVLYAKIQKSTPTSNKDTLTNSCSTTSFSPSSSTESGFDFMTTPYECECKPTTNSRNQEDNQNRRIQTEVKFE